MAKRRKNFSSQTGDFPWRKQLRKLCENLLYISDTDSPVEVFKGQKAESVSADTLLSQINSKNISDNIVKEVSFENFFERLSKIEDWFGDEEKESAEKFNQIQHLLRKNLSDTKVFKIGQLEIEIYAVGLDAEGILSGIQTKAVET